jgi:hypothetical protein
MPFERNALTPLVDREGRIAISHAGDVGQCPGIWAARISTVASRPGHSANSYVRALFRTPVGLSAKRTLNKPQLVSFAFQDAQSNPEIFFAKTPSKTPANSHVKPLTHLTLC